MIKLVYAVVKYGNGRSSSVDVFTEVSFKHASFAIAAGSLFTEVLFQHPFTAETVFHVKPNIPNPRHLWRFTQKPHQFRRHRVPKDSPSLLLPSKLRVNFYKWPWSWWTTRMADSSGCLATPFAWRIDGGGYGSWLFGTQPDKKGLLLRGLFGSFVSSEMSLFLGSLRRWLFQSPMNFWGNPSFLQPASISSPQGSYLLGKGKFTQLWTISWSLILPE